MKVTKSLITFLSIQFLILLNVIQPVRNTRDVGDTNTGTIHNRFRRYKRALKHRVPSCKLNQYFDEEEGRCLGVAGGGKVIYINNTKSCGTNVLKPRCTNSQYYYICKKNKVILAQCAEGQRFENRLQKCVFDNSDSTVNQESIQSNQEISNHIYPPVCQKPGRFPVPGHCSVFYTCETNGHRMFQTVFKCPEKMMYDPESETCTFSSTCENGKSNTSVNICVADMNDEEVISRNKVEKSKGGKSRTVETSTINTFATASTLDSIMTTTDNYETTVTETSNENEYASSPAAYSKQIPPNFTDNSDIAVSPAKSLRGMSRSTTIVPPSTPDNIYEFTTSSDELNFYTDIGTIVSEITAPTAAPEESMLGNKRDATETTEQMLSTTEESEFYEDTTQTTAETEMPDFTATITSTVFPLEFLTTPTNPELSETETTISSVTSSEITDGMSTTDSTYSTSTFERSPTTDNMRTDQDLIGLNQTPSSTLPTNEKNTFTNDEMEYKSVTSTENLTEFTTTQESPEATHSDQISDNSAFLDDTDAAKQFAGPFVGVTQIPESDLLDETTEITIDTSSTASTFELNQTQSDFMHSTESTFSGNRESTEETVLPTTNTASDHETSTQRNEETEAEFGREASSTTGYSTNPNPEVTFTDNVDTDNNEDTIVGATTTSITDTTGSSKSIFIETESVATTESTIRSEETTINSRSDDMLRSTMPQPIPYSRNNTSSKVKTFNPPAETEPKSSSPAANANVNLSSDKESVSSITDEVEQSTLTQSKGVGVTKSASISTVIEPHKTVSTHVALPITSAVLNITDKIERRVRNIINRISIRKSISKDK